MDLEQQFETDRAEARSVAFTDLETSSDGSRFSGYAAVFDSDADLGNFTESISRGAFRKAISSSGNIPMLYDHNPGLPVLATTGGGTLKLKEDGKGLRVDASIAKHFVGDAVREMVSRGDIRGMSFGFVAGPGNSRREDRGTGKPHRTITGFKRLLDVSPTWDPAYQGTNVELRSLRALTYATDELSKQLSSSIGGKVGFDLQTHEFRAMSTGQLENTLEGLQSVAEAMEAALNQVGFGETEPDEQGDAEDVSPGPFSDQQYADALETLQSLIEAAEGLLEGAGLPDPDEGEPSARSASSPGADDTVDAEPIAATGEEEQRSGVDDAVEAEAAARRRRLQMMGLQLPR